MFFKLVTLHYFDRNFSQICMENMNVEVGGLQHMKYTVRNETSWTEREQKTKKFTTSAENEIFTHTVDVL